MDIYEQLKTACRNDNVLEVKNILYSIPAPKKHSRIFKNISSPFFNYLINHPLYSKHTGLIFSISCPNYNNKVEAKISQAFIAAFAHNSFRVLNFFMTDTKFSTFCNPYHEASYCLTHLMEKNSLLLKNKNNSASYLIYNYDIRLNKLLKESNTPTAIQIKEIMNSKGNIVDSYFKLEKTLSVNHSENTSKKHKI